MLPRGECRPKEGEVGGKVGVERLTCDHVRSTGFNSKQTKQARPSLSPSGPADDIISPSPADSHAARKISYLRGQPTR
jgi:hypothetical protein